MGELLYPYLVAVIAMVLVLAASWFAYLRHQKAAIDHEQKARRLPDFVQYMQLQSDVARLRHEHQELLKDVPQAKAIIQEATEKKQWLADNASALQQTQQLVKQLDQVVQDLGTAQQNLAQLRQEAKDADDLLQKRRGEATSEQAKADALRTQQGALKDDIQRLTGQLAQLTGEIDTAGKTLGGLRDQIGTHRNDKEKLEGEITSLTSRRDALQQELDAVTNRKSALDDSVHELTREQGRLTGAVEKLKQLAPSGGAAGKLQLGDLFEPAVKAADWKAPTAPMDEQSALARVENHLRDRKVSFHPRVLRALHTAFKVQSDAPLLVLAGISGTGKSLLPQLYAQAMGIHTQIVPVQPRWDGPQDLLGFYHHLEGRFKPTELTRALLQFDAFLGDDTAQLRAKARGDLSDQMLLVLLDEMNLARVEYYFSEFLSRLETRRDIDPEDAGRRSKAALQLELGHAGDKDRTLEVFAGSNVLFVGTINEDESTQSLSDKVVDRANVMRFGCPKNLAKPEKPGEKQPFVATQWLAADTWDGWIHGAKPLAGNDAKLVESTTDKLKQLMNDVGRAFGHRTSRAIHAYAQQYPDRSPAGVRAALADQVEQRILPKLRGIDPKDLTATKSLEELKILVASDLQDGLLAKAIGTACRDHGFHWQGLDRFES